MIYDVVIAGAGPAGCVLANRLSEDPARKVLLLDAGPDGVVPEAEQSDLLHPFALAPMLATAFHWPNSTADGIPFIQGYGVGGGSNINGMGADRGQPCDYDLWGELGADGWSWEAVLPYFMKMEHDLDFSGPLHGDSGPMPVQRVLRPDWGPFVAAIGDALGRRGYPYIEDYMTDFREGFGPTPMNRLPHRRVSAAMAYLTREVRLRENLAIRCNAHVDRIVVHGSRATGVIVNGETVGARQVIVSCGAIQSPTLLLRSGVDLPGVGANLQNHPAIRLTLYLPKQAAQQRKNGSFLQHWMRLSSHHAECPENDMHLIFFNKMDWHTLGSHVGSIAITVLDSRARGRVELVEGKPTVEFKLLDDARDAERMLTGLRFALDLLSDDEVSGLGGQAFRPNYAVVERLARRTRLNAASASAIASLLDRPRLRHALLGKDYIDLERLRSQEEAMRDFIQTDAQPQLHPVGTCRMGSPGDAEAVVDGSGRVHGFDGLRVVDASIFPTIPRGYTHFPVIMTAEKIADAVKAA